MLCLDTYALIEIAKNSPAYARFTKQDFVLTDITLAEFCGVILRSHNEQTADYWFRKLSPAAKSLSKELLLEAVKFRHKNRKKNLSFFDCAGYVYARNHDIKFLTGDKEFRALAGVEYVK